MSPEKKISKRQIIKARRQRQKRNSRLISIGLMSLGAIFIVFLLVYPGLRTNREFSSRPNANDNVMGNPDAPITVTEYSDYRCSHCATFAIETEPLLVKEYIETGDVKFVYRSMGNWGSGQSIFAVEASYCAGEENKFWEYHDLVFANMGVTLDISNLTAWAEIIELDKAAFKKCMNERRYRDRAEQDGIDGNTLGVEGTPTFFITYDVDGVEQARILRGAQPYEVFQQEIQAALAEMGLE